MNCISSNLELNVLADYLIVYVYTGKWSQLQENISFSLNLKFITFCPKGDFIPVLNLYSVMISVVTLRMLDLYLSLNNPFI